MKYELAKKLKEAGFPQKQQGDYIAPDNEEIYSGDWNDYNTDDCVSLPTLSELIEVCGDKFGSLIRTDRDLKPWDAAEFKEIWSETYAQRVSGSTPEEAVANLWLALHQGK